MYEEIDCNSRSVGPNGLSISNAVQQHWIFHVERVWPSRCMVFIDSNLDSNFVLFLGVINVIEFVWPPSSTSYKVINVEWHLIRLREAFNPLSPDVKLHILLTVLHTFRMELVRIIFLDIKISRYPWWFFSLFSSLECLNKQRWRKEKSNFRHC